MCDASQTAKVQWLANADEKQSWTVGRGLKALFEFFSRRSRSDDQLS